MRILLDTHALLWALAGSCRLDATSRAAIEDPNNEVLFSAISILEIAIKARLRRPDFTARPDVIANEAVARDFVELPVRSDAAARVVELPDIHRDPFDRLLVAQAIAEPAVLYTADPRVAAYPALIHRIGAPNRG